MKGPLGPCRRLSFVESLKCGNARAHAAAILLWPLRLNGLIMSVKIVFVQFCSEKKRFVVNLDEVADFAPKHVEDFVKDKKYDVKWPILKRAESTSSTVADYYPARILLLAGKRKLRTSVLTKSRR